MRELSIRLFQDAMGLTVGAEKKKMKKQVYNSLLPLLFHLHDQSESVAKVGFPNCLVLWAGQCRHWTLQGPVTVRSSLLSP